MASKKRETRGPKWNSFELKLFALVLADDENDFALTLESLALKKSANIHVFESIKKEFDEKLRTQTLATTETTQNETEQPSKSRKKEKRKTIDTSIPKLRAKYKWMKDKWKQYTDRAKSGSGKASFDEPEWFHIIDPIVSETNAKLKLATKADDLNSSLSEDSDYAKSDDGKEFESNKIQLSTRDLQPSPLSIGSNTSSFDGTESTNLDQTCSSADEDEGNNSSSNAKAVSKKEAVKSSVFVQPKKRKVTSQKDAIAKLASSFDNLQKSQEKRMEMWAEAERKREETFLQYQEKQAELNRQHEMQLIEMMIRLQHLVQHPLQPQQNASPWVIPDVSYPLSTFNEASSPQPHYTNLDAFNRKG